jgi:hypothetical protein
MGTSVFEIDSMLLEPLSKMIPGFRWCCFSDPDRKMPFIDSGAGNALKRK